MNENGTKMVVPLDGVLPKWFLVSVVTSPLGCHNKQILI